MNFPDFFIIILSNIITTKFPDPKIPDYNKFSISQTLNAYIWHIIVLWSWNSITGVSFATSKYLTSVSSPMEVRWIFLWWAWWINRIGCMWDRRQHRQVRDLTTKTLNKLERSEATIRLESLWKEADEIVWKRNEVVTVWKLKMVREVEWARRRNEVEMGEGYGDDKE